MKFNWKSFALMRSMQLVAQNLMREVNIPKKLYATPNVAESTIGANVKKMPHYLNEFKHNLVAEVNKFHKLHDTSEYNLVVGQGILNFLGTDGNQQSKTQVSDIKTDSVETGTPSNKEDIVDVVPAPPPVEGLESVILKEGKESEMTEEVAPIVQPKPIEQSMNNAHDKAPSINEIDAKIGGPLLPNASTLRTMLSRVSRQRSVPIGRMERVVSFSKLFTGLSFSTFIELLKGYMGFGGTKNVTEAFFNPENTKRMVDTLCEVRGAALKFGQILSLQDSTIMPEGFFNALERVRQSADYMPGWQVEQVMACQFGFNWHDMLESFDANPFAAASIGQVHRAILKNGMEIAVKVQYPGVAHSIEGDVDNLVGMFKVWHIFPNGFFIDNVAKIAKRELYWEIDYSREAVFTEKYKEMAAPYPEYYVPVVVKELTTTNVISTEMVPGLPMDQCFDLSYEHRKHIAASLMKLCLRELFEFLCMQTDPSWSNFLYDEKTKRIMLIDFGSTRFYQKNFIKNYRDVIIFAANNDRHGVLDMSRQMGLLTGYESMEMEEDHVDTVMLFGEIFRYNGEFDFGTQKRTEGITKLVPKVMANRLCPPPEEIYSIHRKLSGIFLLCSRLNVKMNCREFYDDIIIGKHKD